MFNVCISPGYVCMNTVSSETRRDAVFPEAGVTHMWALRIELGNSERAIWIHNPEPYFQPIFFKLLKEPVFWFITSVHAVLF